MIKSYLPEFISASRISLKRHDVKLAHKMFDYVMEDKERLAKFLPWPHLINQVEDEIAFIDQCNDSWQNHEAAHYGIFQNDENEYLGNISAFLLNWTHASCELGYWILGKFEGHGYMTEAVDVLEQTLFSAGFNRIVIRCEPSNLRSKSIPLRQRYTYEGTLRDVVKTEEGFKDLELFSKIKSDLLILPG